MALPRVRHALTLGLALIGLGCQTGSTSSPGGSQAGTPMGELAALPEPAYIPEKSCRQDFALGETVKPFRLARVDGQAAIAPEGYRGRVMLLNFWGTWCKPCLEELPKFDALYRRYHESGLTLVAVATDEDAAPVEAFINEHKLAARVALGGEDAAGAYERPSFPFSLVVDGEGTIVATYEFVDETCLGELEQTLRTELAKL